jgi:hypothetical protein
MEDKKKGQESKYGESKMGRIACERHGAWWEA